MKISFITGNKKKFEEVGLILDHWELEHVDIDLQEIQGSRHEVIEAKCREALRIMGQPLIVEDVSFCCDALSGMPGPYAKDFLKSLGTEGLYRTIHHFEDHGAQAICMAAYIAPDQEPIITEGIVSGKIVAPKGNTTHGKHSFNQIFIPDGYDKTMGEMSMEEHSECSHRRFAFLKLKAELEAQAVS